jgi:hypothetical protein
MLLSTLFEYIVLIFITVYSISEYLTIVDESENWQGN